LCKVKANLCLAIINGMTVKNHGTGKTWMFCIFVNLLVHPFLEKITHHTPVLMLIAMVSVAALLVPMHHRLEKNLYG